MNAFLYLLRINHLNLCPAVTVASCHLWASKSTNLFFTEPMKVLAHVLGSKLTNHWGIVLAFFVYIHFVPNLKFGAKVYIFINVRKMALSDCLPSAAVCKDSLHTDISSNSFSLKMLRICIVILLRVIRNNSVICAWVSQTVSWSSFTSNLMLSSGW